MKGKTITFLRLVSLCINPKHYEFRKALFRYRKQCAGKREKRRILFVASLYVRLVKIVHKHDDALMILSEGLVSFLAGVHFGKLMAINAELEHLIGVIKLNLQIDYIYCDVDIDVSMQRVRNRGKLNRWHNTPAETSEQETVIFEMQKANIIAILNLLSADCKTINMDGKPDEVYKAFEEYLEDIVGRPKCI